MRAKPRQQVKTVRIESLDQEGRGVAHHEGKVAFIEGGLPGELVTYTVIRGKPSYDFGEVEQVLEPSSQRVQPGCPHFGVCGGCAMQHLEAISQVAAKQRMLEDQLWHIGRVKPERMLSPIAGPAWAYRHKARLRVRYVMKKGGMLVGFNERASSFVADIQQCRVLPKHVSDLLLPLRGMIEALTIKDSLPQIELAVGEHSTVLVLRILQPLADQDLPILEAFASEHGVQLWTQSKGPDTVRPLFPAVVDLPEYSLPEYGLRYPFHPTEFTQVNPAINRVMIRRAMQLLSPQADERIADFFCGLGNFSLPMARSGATVLGIEGSAALVKRAQENAELNGLGAKVSYQEADIFDMTPERLLALGAFDKWLIDPPRDGAIELIKALPDHEPGDDHQTHIPKCIVYVSCNPSTLSRDAAVLVQRKGYVLKACGIINMFPHTTHVESMALFELA